MDGWRPRRTDLHRGVKRLQLMETCREMVTDLLGRRVDGRLVVEGRNGFGPLPGQLSVTGHGRCGPKPSVAERSGCFGRCGQKEPGHADPGGAAAQQLQGLACHTTAHFYTLITQRTKFSPVCSFKIRLPRHPTERVRSCTKAHLWHHHVARCEKPVSSGVYLKKPCDQPISDQRRRGFWVITTSAATESQ